MKVSRLGLRSLLVLGPLLGIGAVTACVDSGNPLPPSTDAGADAGGNGQPGDVDSGTPPDGGGQPPPNTVFQLPLDTMLLTYGKPRNIDTETDIALLGTYHYGVAYQGTELLTTGRRFRFVQRSFDAEGELPAGGIRVWWIRLSDDGSPSAWVCRETSYDIRVLDSHGSPESESEPEPLYRQQCSWTLWKHATEDTWALRQPAPDSDADGGLFVTDRHSTANQGYRIQIAPETVDTAPFFRFESWNPEGGI